MSYTYSFENVESTDRRGDHHPRQLWVPVQLLDLLLALVDEEQLRGDSPNPLATAVVVLHRQVPLYHLGGGGG